MWTTNHRAAASATAAAVMCLMLLLTAPARAQDTAIGEPISIPPPPPTIIYLAPPVAVWQGGALHEQTGVRPLSAAPLLCERSPCAVRAGMVVAVGPDGEGVVVEARYSVALPLVRAEAAK